ncbi:MAG: hypothetical protein ACE5JF_06920 [Anaerolineales bacterium]
MPRWFMAVSAIGLFVLGGLLGFLLGGDALAAPEPTLTNTPVPSITPSPTPTDTPTSTPTLTETHTSIPSATATIANTPTPLYTPTITLTPSLTPTPSITPTFAPIAAKVLVQSNCRYGPGAAYLYEWGLYPDVRVDIVGRNDLGTWAYVEPWTYFDRCWVKSEFLEIRGDLRDAPPYYSRLPFGELYRPPTNARASRNGDDVTIAWDAVWMTTDDDRGYLIEAWLCQDRQLIFTPLRTTHWEETTIHVRDEAGCQQPSGARLYTAEKHGYTQWVLIPWPAHDSP